MARKKLRCQVFVDPIYGSERYIEVDPTWVVTAEEQQYKLRMFSKMLLKRKEWPVTELTLSNGRKYLIDGHWAERIKAAQDEAKAAPEAAPEAAAPAE